MKKLLGVVFLFALVFCTFGKIQAEEVDNSKIPIDESHFPDLKIRNAVSIDADKDKDGMLTVSERNAFTSLVAKGSDVVPIRSLQGVEVFPNLSSINLSKIEQFKQDSVTMLTKLKSLIIIDHKARVVDFSKLKSLNSLRYMQQAAYSWVGIDLKYPQNAKISLPVNLEKCSLCNVQAKKIVFPKMLNLKELSMDGSDTNAVVDVSKLKNLKKLNLKYYESINLKSNTKLVDLNLSGIDNKTLDLSKCKKLRKVVLDISSKVVKLPKVSSKAKGMSLKLEECYDLEKCNFNDAKNLTYIYVGQGKIKSFSVPNLKRLKELNLEACKNLKSINVLKCKALTKISLSETAIQSLDLSKNKKLNYIWFDDSKKFKVLYLPKHKKIEIWGNVDEKVKRK